MSQDAQLLKLAFAYAGAVGKLSGTMRVLIDHVADYSEMEKIKMMKKLFRKYMDIDRSQSLSLGSGHSESQPVSIIEE